MNTPRFAELGRQGRGPGVAAMSKSSASLAAAKGDDPELEPDDDEVKPDSEKEKPMSDPKKPAASDAAEIDTTSADYRAGQSAERERLSTVVASEHYAGREALATDLFASDMSADKIVAALGKAPKAAATDGAADEDDADRALMRDKLQGKNPELGDDDADEDAGAKAKADNYGWGKAHATVAKRYGRKAAK